MLHCGNLGFSFRWDLWVAELQNFGKLSSWILGSFYRGTSLIVLQGEGDNLWSFYRGESLVVYHWGNFWSFYTW